GVTLFRQCDQRRTTYHRKSRSNNRWIASRPAVKGVMVACGRIDRGSGVGVAHERQCIAHRGQQSNLEAPEHESLIVPAGKVRERRFVIAEKLRMRILARQELEQELVQVEPAEERAAAYTRQATPPLGAQQRLEFLLARPGQEQRLEGLQEPPQFGARAL